MAPETEMYGVGRDSDTKLPKGSCTVGGLCNEQTQDLVFFELRKPVKYKMTYDIFPDIFMPRSIPCARTTLDIIHFFISNPVRMQYQKGER